MIFEPEPNPVCRLAGFTEAWRAAGASAAHLRILEHGFELPWASESRPTADRQACQPRLSPIEAAAAAELLEEMRASGALAECDRSELVVINPVFVIPKKATSGESLSKRWRLIVNAKRLNGFLAPRKFKNPGWSDVRMILQPGAWATKFDLASGFHHVPLNASAQRYMGVRCPVTGRYMKILCLPFGLSASPAAFDTMTGFARDLLRKQGLALCWYTDDVLVVSPSRDQAVLDSRTTVELLQRLGWVLSLKKCVPVPCQHIEYLGFVLDLSSTPSIQVPASKRRDLRHQLLRVLRWDRVPLRVLASVVGKAMAMSTAVFTAPLRLRGAMALLRGRRDWRRSCALSQAAREDLQFWAETVMSLPPRALVLPPTSVAVDTDASLTGWGASCGNQVVNGYWDTETAARHINYLELRCVYLMLTAWQHRLRGETVRLRTDSAVTLSYLSKPGGRVPSLNKQAIQIFDLLEAMGTTLVPEHLPGRLNVTADAASRMVAPAQQWKLRKPLFDLVMKRAPCVCDRFASAANAQLPRFNTAFPEPGAEAVDALAQQWPQGPEHRSWVNPPFALLPKVITHLWATQAEAAVLAPIWPTAAWFMPLLGMATDVLELPPVPLLSTTARICGKTVEVTRNSRWRTAVFVVSGSRGRAQAARLGKQLLLAGSRTWLRPWQMWTRTGI